MKTNILSFTVLAAFLAAGCSKTEVPPQSWRTDPDAVIVDASVGTLTRSNPLGNLSEQKTFNIGDEITIKQSDVVASSVYTYKFDGTSWSPSGSDYLVWIDNGVFFEAWYPAKDQSLTDQSTLEGIAKADAMYAEKGYSSIPSDHRVKLVFNRLRSLVTVKIKGYNDEFDPATDKITDMKIYLSGRDSWSNEAVKPYVRDAAGQASDAAGTVGFSYSAIGLRHFASGSKLFIEFKVGEKTLTVTGCPKLEPGTAYTFNLTVGKTSIDADDITVSDWSDPVDLNGGNEFEAGIDGEAWDGSIATSFESGTGTEADPYIIATPSQLAYLAQQVNKSDQTLGGDIHAFEGKYYRQTNDFVLANIPWTPIGCTRSYGYNYTATIYFSGHYDGNGKKVYGLNVKRQEVSYCGLFGAVSKGSISNCTVFGRVEGENSTRVGGIVGCLADGATMTNCAAEVTVKGEGNVGGLCGSLYSGSISGCSVVNCSVEGASSVGCLVGYIWGYDGSAALKDCSASGIVTGARYVGGVVGYVGNSKAPMEISGCTVNADLTVLASVTTTGKWGKEYKGDFCGGLAGFVDYKTEDKPGSAKFSDCGFNGTITKGGKDVENVGAAIGCDWSDATFTGCWYNADKTGDLPLVAIIEHDAVGKEYTGIEARHLGN